MENKMTNKKALTFVLENCTLPEEVADKVKAMIATLDKKSANRKPSARQKENVELKEIVFGALTEEGSTVSEIQLRDERISATSGISSQRVTALLRVLCEEGKVERVVEKKKSLYKIKAVEE